MCVKLWFINFCKKRHQQYLQHVNMRFIASKSNYFLYFVLYSILKPVQQQQSCPEAWSALLFNWLDLCGKKGQMSKLLWPHKWDVCPILINTPWWEFLGTADCTNGHSGSCINTELQLVVNLVMQSITEYKSNKCINLNLSPVLWDS